MTEENHLTAYLRSLQAYIADPQAGLPEEVFLFVSSVTPLVNVDLLIKDDAGRTLLTWREDAYYGPGWHVPGGVIRYQEPAADRIRTVARQELGAEVEFDSAPVAVHELIDTGRRERGHSISLLYRCRVTTPLDEARRAACTMPQPNQWAWHEGCPDNLISEHRIYSRFLRG